MKKIPTIFVRDFEGNPSRVLKTVTPGCEWVLVGTGTPTAKYDGTCVLIRDGIMFKRHDRKFTKAAWKLRRTDKSMRDTPYRFPEDFREPPANWEPAQPEPDLVSGHWPGWVQVLEDDPNSKWHLEVMHEWVVPLDGTYELCGPKIGGNPHGFTEHLLAPHDDPVNVSLAPRLSPYMYADYEKLMLAVAYEGIVWHDPDGRMAKLKRSDFGYPWPIVSAS